MPELPTGAAHHQIATPRPMVEVDEVINSASAAAEQSNTEEKLTGPVTLEAISKLLDQKISPVVSSVDRLTADLGVFKERMNSELASMGLRLKEMERESTEAKAKVHALETKAEKRNGPADQEITDRITRILEGMNLVSPGPHKDETMTIVIGNIPGVTTIEQAKEWVAKQCGSKGIPKPLDTFCKSDEFGGIVFAKCQSVAHRDALIAGIRGTPTMGGKTVWAKVDQPIDARTVDGILFGFKRMLVDWGYNKRAVWVNTDSKALSVAGKEIVKVSVQDRQLVLQWCDSEWQQWEELQTATELTKIKDDAQTKLNHAKELAAGSTKGKGKSFE
jgi:hypothetical protein